MTIKDAIISRITAETYGAWVIGNHDITLQQQRHNPNRFWFVLHNPDPLEATKASYAFYSLVSTITASAGVDIRATNYNTRTKEGPFFELRNPPANIYSLTWPPTLQNKKRIIDLVVDEVTKIAKDVSQGFTFSAAIRNRIEAIRQEEHLLQEAKQASLTAPFASVRINQQTIEQAITDGLREAQIPIESIKKARTAISKKLATLLGFETRSV